MKARIGNHVVKLARGQVPRRRGTNTPRCDLMIARTCAPFFPDNGWTCGRCKRAHATILATLANMRDDHTEH